MKQRYMIKQRVEEMDNTLDELNQVKVEFYCMQEGIEID